MKIQPPVLLAVSLSPLLLASGCSDSPATVACTSAAVTNPEQQVACMGANVIANEANNYSFASEIKLTPVTVKSMTDLKLDWSGVTRDFLGRQLDPATDMDVIVLLFWQLPRETLETNLNADTLLQTDLRVSPPPSWLNVDNVTSTQLFSLRLNGTAVPAETFSTYLDPVMFPPAAFSYMIAAQSGTMLGTGFRMLQAFNLDPASSATTVALTNNSTQLTCEVSLRNLTITGVPGGTPNLMLDWSMMTTNALGAEFLSGQITSAIVAHFDETPAELEKKFLDLDQIATAYYRATVESGSVLDFTTLRDSNDAPFPGVDDSGTWLVGLQCGNCRNPAPWYMTILKPCAS